MPKINLGLKKIDFIFNCLVLNKIKNKVGLALNKYNLRTEGGRDVQCRLIRRIVEATKERNKCEQELN
jgi:hypothetical protein